MIEGRHIKVLGHGADPAKLADVEHVKSTIAGIIALCGMRPLGLHAYDVEVEIAKLNAVPFEDEGGVTVIGVLSTSHVSIHTWPVRGYFVLDVYSCRDFEAGPIVDALADAFDRYEAGFRTCALRPGGVECRTCWSTGKGGTRVRPGSTWIRMIDLSFALDIPAEWREPAPEFRQKT